MQLNKLLNFFFGYFFVVVDVVVDVEKEKLLKKKNSFHIFIDTNIIERVYYVNENRNYKEKRIYSKYTYKYI